MPYLRYVTLYSNEDENLYYTSEDIAKMLKISEFTVRRWIGEGKLNGLKIGKAYRFTKDDIDNFINKFKQNEK